jgi:hypothetical protein
MERTVCKVNLPITNEEVRGEWNLRCERLNMKSTSHVEGKVLEEQALFIGKYKGKSQNC